MIAHLTNLSADLDLALLGPAQAVLKPTTTPGRAPQDPPIRDTGVDRASVNTSLEPAGLQDTPITQQPITQHSINRNTSEEDAVGIAPPGGADFVVRVAGYNDAVRRPAVLAARPGHRPDRRAGVHAAREHAARARGRADSRSGGREHALRRRPDAARGDLSRTVGVGHVGADGDRDRPGESRASTGYLLRRRPLPGRPGRLRGVGRQPVLGLARRTRSPRPSRPRSTRSRRRIRPSSTSSWSAASTRSPPSPCRT